MGPRVSSEGHQKLKSWDKVSMLEQRTHIAEVSKSCRTSDLQCRVRVENELHDVCVDMCKELGAYPTGCTCPDYVDTTDKTPGVLTWDELLTYMSEVAEKGHAQLKAWGA